MHKEVPLCPFQCCQVTFVCSLQKPFVSVLDAPCTPWPGSGTSGDSPGAERPMLGFMSFHLLSMHHGILFSSSASPQLLPVTPPASFPKEIGSIFLSPNWSQFVNPALLREGNNPMWSWLREFPPGAPSSGCGFVLLLGSSSQYS